MPAGVKLHAAGGDLGHIQVRVDDALHVPHGLRLVAAVGINDAAAAAAEDAPRLGCHLVAGSQILRVRILRDNHIAVHHIAAPFQRDVTDRVLPLGIVIGVAGNIQTDALLIESHPRQRHVALPANHAAHRSPGRLHHREIILIRIAPHAALLPRRLQLSVQRHFAFRRNKNIRIVQRPGKWIPLRKSQAHPDFVLLHFFNDGLRFLAAHNDRRIGIALPIRPPRFASLSRSESKSHAIGIAGNEELRKYNELRPMRRRLFQFRQHLLHTSRRIKHLRLRLHHGQFANAFLYTHIFFSFSVID